MRLRSAFFGCGTIKRQEKTPEQREALSEERRGTVRTIRAHEYSRWEIWALILELSVRLEVRDDMYVGAVQLTREDVGKLSHMTFSSGLSGTFGCKRQYKVEKGRKERCGLPLLHFRRNLVLGRLGARCRM
jgi:hypothetical protein